MKLSQNQNKKKIHGFLVSNAKVLRYVQNVLATLIVLARSFQY